MGGQGSVRRGPVTSLLFVLCLGLHVLGGQVQATEGSVDLQHIKDLSAQIDLKTAYTTWLHHPPPLPGPSPYPHPRSAPVSQHPDNPQASTVRDRLGSSAPDKDSRRSAVYDHPRRQFSDPGDGSSRSSVPSQHVSTQTQVHSDHLSVSQTSQSVPGKLGGPLRPGKAVGDKPSSMLPDDDFRNGGVVRSDGKETNWVVQDKTKAETNKAGRWTPEGDLSSPTQLGDPTSVHQANTQRALPVSTHKGPSYSQPRQKRAPWDIVSPAVTHMSAKRLAMLEDDLTRRRQTEPEHKLYHQDLLLRRLKTLRQDRKHGADYRPAQERGPVEEEEDSWEEELRIRRQLADKAQLYGLEKRKERTAHPDPNRPLSVMERIHQDAEEILKRRAQETEYWKKMLKHKPRTKTHSQSPSEEAFHIMAHGEDAESPPNVPYTFWSRQMVGEGTKTDTADSQLRVGQGVDHFPVSARHSPQISARHRRRMKHRSKSLVRALGRQKRLQ